MIIRRKGSEQCQGALCRRFSIEVTNAAVLETGEERGSCSNKCMTVETSRGAEEEQQLGRRT
jgi:hypothetical protein